MARRLEAATAETIDSRANLTAFDSKQFKKDVEGVMALREEIATANQGNSSRHKMLEKERGYHMGAFKNVCSLMKMSPEGRADYLRTLLAGIRACDLYPQKDLVDLMGDK